jgi:hypothetical protein
LNSYSGSFTKQIEWLEKAIPNYMNYKNKIVNYINKFRRNSREVKDPDRKCYRANLYVFDKSKMPRSAIEEAKCTKIFEDEKKIVIPHTDIKKAISSNPYDFSKPYNSKENIKARKRHFKYGIEYPSLLQGLNPE